MDIKTILQDTTKKYVLYNNGYVVESYEDFLDSEISAAIDGGGFYAIETVIYTPVAYYAWAVFTDHNKCEYIFQD